MNQNPVSQRDNYTRILGEYQKIGKGNVRLTESSLMLLQPFDSNKSKIVFPVLDSDQKNSVYIDREIRLNMNDEFVILQAGVYLLAKIGSQNAIFSTYKFLSYPPVELSDEFLVYYEFYQTGKLRIAVNNIVFMENYDVHKHLFVPDTQFADYSFSSQVYLNSPTQPNIRGDRDAMYALEPNIVLSGAVKNEITIEYNEGLGVISKNFKTGNGINDQILVEIEGVALVFRGFLAQNAAKFQ